MNQKLTHFKAGRVAPYTADAADCAVTERRQCFTELSTVALLAMAVSCAALLWFLVWAVL